jgi:dTDP-4-dehydrorhamnose reductase
MLRLGKERESLNVVDDQIGAPTTAAELARATHAVTTEVIESRFDSQHEWAGVYHMSCAGSVSWCGFARAIFARAPELVGGKTPQVNPIATSDYPTPAKRPHNSVLSNAKLKRSFGIELSSWETALDDVLGAVSAQQKD